MKKTSIKEKIRRSGLLGKKNSNWFRKEKEQGIGLRSNRRTFLIQIKEKRMTRTVAPLKDSI